MAHLSFHLETNMSTFHVLRMYYKLFGSLHAYLTGESRTFNLKLGCTKDLYSEYVYSLY